MQDRLRLENLRWEREVWKGYGPVLNVSMESNGEVRSIVEAISMLPPSPCFLFFDLNPDSSEWMAKSRCVGI